MGTIGGNLCLDTRCVYINQTQFWRQSLGFCLKKDGDRCHVVPSGQRCVAAFSADTPGPLIALGAEVSLVSSRGTRRLAVADFFSKDGVHNTVKAHDELVTAIHLPPVGDGRSASAYTKLRARQAIDFPTLSVAAAATWGGDGNLRTLEVVVGGLGPKPRPITKVSALALGRTLDRALIDEISALAARQCSPLDNISASPDWRREVIPVQVARTLAELG
jgi:4-hydroxybenzoyl-CoA reductase subunit beta